MPVVEVVIIGPGYGESILVDFGDGTWMVMDSCVRKGSGTSLALEFLAARGVDVGRQVCLVVASHWHDDHVRGLAGVLEAARNAEFCCSTVLRDREFAALADHHVALGSRVSSSGVGEFRKIMGILADRGQQPQWAVTSRRLLGLPTLTVRAVWTLSPADGEVFRSLERFAAAGAATNPAFRAPNIAANDSAVALYVELFDGTGILLGSDVEHHVAGDRGWHAILRDPGRPTGRAHLYKVAHHGSANGHCPAAWGPDQCDLPGCAPVAGSPLLEPGRTVCVVTPWKRGLGRLPQPSDLERLQSMAGGVHLTPGTAGSPRKSMEDADAVRRNAGMASTMTADREAPEVLRCVYAGGAWTVTPETISFPSPREELRVVPDALADVARQ